LTGSHFQLSLDPFFESARDKTSAHLNTPLEAPSAVPSCVVRSELLLNRLNLSGDRAL
jgi:hypothetical protein